MSLLYKNSKNVLELSPKQFKITNINKKILPNFNKPILTIFYAHWCPHCSNPTMIEFVEALAEVLPKKSGIIVAAFNCDFNSNHRDIAQNLDITGFPTIRYFNNGKSSDYNGPREVKPILNFLLQNS